MAFPLVTLLDSFKREENPLSNSGKWKTFFPVTHGTGLCNGTDWENITPGESPQGAYWSPSEFKTTVGVSIERDKNLTDGGYWSLWACISNPTTSEISGYRVKLIYQSGNKFEVKTERCIKNSFTVLATKTGEEYHEGDRIGLAVQAGKVEHYRKIGGGAWEERSSAADATYTHGFVGFVVAADNGDTANFEAGDESSTKPSVTNPGRQHSVLFKPVSFQIHAANITKYFATGLPTGLSINETTGLITGETEVEESALVKIKVENETAETAETSFEWDVTAKPNNVISMILG